MNSVLDTLETRKLVMPISRAFYHEAGEAGVLDRNVELIEGIILKKMPKSPYHILLVRRLLAQLNAALKREDLSNRYFVSKEDPLAIGESEPEPDLAVISGTSEQYARELPMTAEFIIEVAVSTLERDRLKAKIYAKAGVCEYWIVNGDSKQIECHSQVDANAALYREKDTCVEGGTLASATFPSFEVDLSVLFRAHLS